MGKKKNEQQEAEKNFTKKSNKTTGKVNVTQDKAPSYTTTISLVDCTYCEELEEELKETKKRLKLVDDLHWNLENEVTKLKHELERSEAMHAYTLECLQWAEKHLGHFASKKYEKLFSKKALVDFLLQRRYVYIATEEWTKADAIGDMLLDLRD